MQHTYEVRFHTGNSWSRGCASSLSFVVHGSQYNLSSDACVRQEVPVVVAKRSRAVLFAATGGDSTTRKRNGDASAGVPPEKRNVFTLVSRWLETAGGAAQLKRMVKNVDEGGDGLLALGEVQQLLEQAVPSVSKLETQLFFAMVDLNGDGVLSEQELLQSVGDCAGIDTAVSAGGSVPDSRPDSGAGPPGAAGHEGNMVGTLAATVQHLRSNSGTVDAKLLEINPAGGYLTFGQLNELFQAVVPESLGGRAALRALMAHVARTANISPLDPGVHVMEFKRCFGLQAAAVAGGAAAVAAGWVPGRPRDLFKLLRYHVKHNRAQLDELFPRGSELTVNQVRHLVRQMLGTRAGEPALTGREARHLVAVLDANGNGTLSREEFDSGLRDCRDISAGLTKVRCQSLDTTALQLQPDAPIYPHPGAATDEASPPTWGPFLGALQQLHDLMVERHEDAEAAWRRHDSRGKGRIDACELRKVLLELAPTLLPLPLLRAVLIYVDGWDPSEHALLSRKHFLTALRGDRSPDSLHPQTAVPLASVGEAGTATSTPPLLNISRGLTRALYGGNVDRGVPGFLPNPAQWQKWHGNIKTSNRSSGAVTLGGSQLPVRPGFWKAQWKWHTAWLAASTTYRQAPAPPGTAAPAPTSRPTSPPGPGQNTVDAATFPEPNCLECRMWPPVSVTSLPYINAVSSSDLTAWKKTLAEAAAKSPQAPAADLDPENLRGGADVTSALQGSSPAAAPVALMARQMGRPVAEAMEVEGEQQPGTAALGPPAAAQAHDLTASQQQTQAGAALRDSPVALGRDRTAIEDTGKAADIATGAAVPHVAPAPEAGLGPAARASPPGAAESAVLQQVSPSKVPQQPITDAAASEVAPGTEQPRHPDSVPETAPPGALEPTGVKSPLVVCEPPAAMLESPPAAMIEKADGVAAMELAEAVAPEKPAVASLVVQQIAGLAKACASGSTEPHAAAALEAPPTAQHQDGRLAVTESPVPKPRQPQTVESFQSFQVPPLVVPARLLLYKVVLAPGAQLGNVDSVTVKVDDDGAAICYLDRVEVVCTTTETPLAWEVTVRRWLQPGEQLVGLQPDPVCWEEWELQQQQQQEAASPVAPSCVLFVNRNGGEVAWSAPPKSPLPALPGAVPVPQLKDWSRPSTSPRPGPINNLGAHQLLAGVTALPGSPRVNVRFLESLQKPPAFRPMRVRATYELGFGGQLGAVPGREVRVRGQRCSRSIAVMARGGFKAVDQEDTNAIRLLPAMGVPGRAMYSKGGGGAAPESAAATSAMDPLGGGLFPGIRECVVLSYSLEAAAEELWDKYLWLDGYVALDDSSGTPPAPVRFNVVRDGALVWARWVRAAGEVYRCCVPVMGCRELQLVVETDFSGGALAVWLDPYLLCAPLHDKPLVASLERASRENEVADCSTGDIKVAFVTEAGGAIMYMAPACSVPAEVSRSSSIASYRISVFTGPEKNGGTRGRVYMRLQGRRGSGVNASAVKSNLICINNDGTVLKAGDKYSLLEPVTLPWMDEVDSVALQHVPAPVGLMAASTAVGGSNDWSVQHVEVSCGETGRTWYFVACGWFLELAGRQSVAAGGRTTAKVSPAQLELVLPRVTSPSQLKVVFHIISSGKGVGMGIDGDLQIVLVGMDGGGYQYASLSLPGHSIDSPHETRLLESPLPLGELQSVELTCKQQGLLGTRLQFVEVVRLTDAKHFLFLPPTPDLAESADPAATSLVLRAATQPYFRIATFTSAMAEASTDARVYIDLFGSRGKLLDLYLRDATGDSFNEGCEDVFFFPDPGLGDLGSVCISHDDSGDSPNWHLDRVEITHTGTGRTSVFACKQWIGLGANRQDASQIEGRFGPDRVLERVLYPTHVLAALKNGKPLLRYHVIFHTDSSRAELCHTAEALQLVGEQADGGFQFSEVVILDSGRVDMDLELDMQYVQHIQAASRAEAQQGLEDVDEPPLAAEAIPISTARCTYQVVLKKLAMFQPHANIVLNRTSARQLTLVLHGSLDSCRPILLGADNSTTGMPPFTSHQADDVFQVTCDTPLGPRLLRADVRLPSSASPDWGILLESVTIRETSNASGVPTEFFAGSRGQWVGVSPDTPEGVVGGTQALHLLPAGSYAVSFVGRALHGLAALHVRHDSPGWRTGWRLRGIEVLISPPPGAPVRVEPSVAAATLMEAVTQPAAGQQPALAISPRLYRFPGFPQQPRGCWPSIEAPFIRHFLTDKYLSHPFPPQAYFKPPLVSSIQLREATMPPSIIVTEESGGVGLAPIDTAATAALLDTPKPDPDRLQALTEEYRAEVAAYLHSASGPGAPGADLFTLMRARIRAEPHLLPSEFSHLSKDMDGKLNRQQVLDLVPRLLPVEMQCSEQQSMYVRAMLTLESEEPLTQTQLMCAIKACRSAYKEAASMVRMVEEGSVDWYQLAQEDGLAIEMALCRLAEQLVQPGNAQAAVEAFKQYDTDGSGYLDIGELCKALQSIPDLKLSSREVRLLLAFLFHFGDKERDLRLSVLELQTSLAPFVPRLPAEELERAYQAYRVTHNLPALLGVVNKLQPALLPAVCMQQAKATAVAVAVDTRPHTASVEEKVDLVPLASLLEIVSAALPGLDVHPEEVAQLHQLVALDTWVGSLPVKELVTSILLSADAVKRASSIARMVSTAMEEHECVKLDIDLQSSEVVLHRLAKHLVQDDGAQLAAAFRKFDKDGSGYLDGPELCAAIRQVDTLTNDEEVRTILAYIQRYADKDADGRISMEELQVVLNPFIPVN